jgi:hypothetical protein
LTPQPWPSDVDTAAGYQRYLNQRAEELGKAVSKTEDLAGALARLRVARWQLSRQIEPQLSMIVLGFANEADRLFVVQVAGEARRQLDKAATFLRTADGEEQVQAARDELNLLSYWPDVFETVARSNPAQRLAAAQKLDSLALSRYRSVVQAARFWQAILYHDMGQSDNALNTLELALADARDEHYRAFPRLLRCKVLAETGKLTAALALILRLDKRFAEWFDQDEAILFHRAATLIRVDVLDRWSANVKRGGRQAHAEGLRIKGRKLRDATFPPGRITELPRLGQVLPEPEPARPTSRPVTTVASPAE